MTLYTTLLLLAAITAELAGTSALKLSNGFTRVIPSLVVVVGYMASFYFLALVLKYGMPIGIAYAMWAGLGTVGIVLIGLLVWQETLNIWSIIGIGLVITGVVLLNLNSGAHT